MRAMRTARAVDKPEQTLRLTIACSDMLITHFAQKRGAGGPAPVDVSTATAAPAGRPALAAAAAAAPPRSWSSTPPPGAAERRAGRRRRGRRRRRCPGSSAACGRCRPGSTATGWWQRTAAARIAVVRVSTLAVPRLDRKPPPPPPMPSPPPSDFCSRTRPTMASTIMRWIRMMTVCMTRPAQAPAGPTGPVHDPSYRNSPRSLHDPLAAFPPRPGRLQRARRPTCAGRQR